MWLDSNAPLYYVFIWAWPFESNFGLRVPSFLFLVAAAAVAAFARPAVVSRRAAYFWAFLLVIWQPGITLFFDARYYALLYLISTAQTVAYINLLDGPGLRRAFVWTGLATLGILTHYYAAMPAIAQGVYYLWRHRWVAVRTWPAMFATLPALAWGLYHLPRLRLYAQPGISWYREIEFADLPDNLLWPIGGGSVIAGLGLLFIAWLFRTRVRLPRSLVAAVATAAVAAVLLVLAGMLRPMFIYRYLLPVVPPLLLGIAATIRPTGYFPAAIWLFGFMAVAASPERVQRRANFGLEQPARLLGDVQTVTWMLDYPGASIHDRDQMEAMLADAFRRTGRTVEPRWGTELTSGDGLVWFYKPDKRPIVEQIKSRWHCHDVHSREHVGLVCSKPR